jgi:hypothetical protein
VDGEAIQATIDHRFALKEHGGNFMAYGQRDDMFASITEERIAALNECCDFRSRKSREGHLKFAVAAGVGDVKLDAGFVTESCTLYVSERYGGCQLDTIARISDLAKSDRRDQFIPVRKEDLFSALIKQGDLADPAERELFWRFGRTLRTICHYEYSEMLDRLRDDYY